jgi:hypothetical protein
MTLTAAQQKGLAAVLFAAAALLSVRVMFHAVTMGDRGIVLYHLLPTVAGGIAGALCGAPILNRANSRTLRQSVLRGVVVAAVAFVIFAVVFAFVLPFVEPGQSLRQSGSILWFTLTLGILLGGPIVVFGGIFAGATLHLIGRVFGD